MKSPACCLSDWSHLFKMKMASFLAGTMEGAEEKEIKVPAMPEILKKKEKNFTELKIKCWEIICLKDVSKGKKFIYEKAKPYHKEDKQIYRTEFKWLGWQEKPETSVCPQDPNWHLSSGTEVSKIWKALQLCLSQMFSGTSWSSTRFQLTCWEGWNHTVQVV